MDIIIQNIDNLRATLNTLEPFTPEWNSVRKHINDLENKLADMGGSYPVTTNPITDKPNKPCSCTVKKVNIMFILATGLILLYTANK